MGYAVVAEDNLINVLKNLSQNSGFTFGLILGQSSSTKDYIVRVAPSAVPEDNDKSVPEGGDICTVKELGDYDDKWIASHTRNVIKMLPGGMTILGVFVTCTDSSSDTNVFNKLRTLAIHSYNCIKNNAFLHQNKSSNKLLLQYNLNSKTYVCKSIDAGSLNASLQPVDLKFTSEAFKWYSVDSSINLVNFSSHFIPKSNNNVTLKKMLKDVLLVLQSKIDVCQCSIDHKFVNMADDLKTFKEKEERQIKELEKLTGKKINFDSKSVEVQLYDKRVPEEFSFKVEHVEHCVEVVFKGDIRSRVFVTGLTSLEDTINAVKEDLIRCCATKFEMHWETNDAVIIGAKNEERTNEELHVLPRRVLFSVPDSCIQFSEYLFLDETAEEIIPSIQENLGFQIPESSVLDVLEAKCVTSVPTNSNDGISSKKDKSVAKENRSTNLFLISVVIVSLLVLLISLFIQFK